MTYRYNGPCGKGFERKRREQKRIEAELRAEETPHERTKAHRLGKCEHGQQQQSETPKRERKRRRAERPVSIIRPRDTEEAAA